MIYKIKHKPQIKIRHFQTVKKRAIKRDKGICQKCGKTGEEVHHKEPRYSKPELYNHIDNLITLCKKCHDKQHLRHYKGKFNYKSIKEYQSN